MGAAQGRISVWHRQIQTALLYFRLRYLSDHHTYLGKVRYISPPGLLAESSFQPPKVKVYLTLLR